MKKVSCVDMSQCLVPVLKPSGIHSVSLPKTDQSDRKTIEGTFPQCYDDALCS